MSKPETVPSATRSKQPKKTRSDTFKRLPMHLQIRKFIVQQIQSGQWRPGDKIPSEHDLLGQFGVSRMTVLQAVRDLCNDGLLRRQQGSGTYVAQPQTHLTVVNVVDIAQEIKGRNHEHTATVIQRERRSATISEAKKLGIKIGSPLFHTVLVHFENAVPVQIEDRLINPSSAPSFLDIDYGITTSFSYLMSLHPYPAGTHVIRSTEPTARIKRLLQLQPGEPCLEIERITWANDKVVTAVRLIHPGFRYEMRGDIERR